MLLDYLRQATAQEFGPPIHVLFLDHIKLRTEYRLHLRRCWLKKAVIFLIPGLAADDPHKLPFFTFPLGRPNLIHDCEIFGPLRGIKKMTYVGLSEHA